MIDLHNTLQPAAQPHPEPTSRAGAEVTTVAEAHSDHSAPSPREAAEQGRKSTPRQEQLTLSPEAEAVVQELKNRDQEVRNHEMAHMAAGGGMTGGASYSYQTGPDGQRYAVGGEVQINTPNSAGDPGETIKNAETVRRAALAPANPSAQDMAVAAAATQTINTAQAELSRQNVEEREKSHNSDTPIDEQEKSEERSHATTSETDREQEQITAERRQHQIFANRASGAGSTGTLIDTAA